MAFLQPESIDQKNSDGSITLSCGLYGGAAEALYRAWYVWRGDPKPVLAQLPADLAPLQQAAQSARRELEQAAAETEEVVTAAEALATRQAEDRDKKRNNPSKATHRARKHYDNVFADAQLQLAREPAHAQGQQAIHAWESALASAAMAHGDVHRDYYAYPLLQRPAKTMQLEHQRALHQAFAADSKRRGTLRWILRPAQQVVAGWPWQGWTQHYEVALDGEAQASVVYQLATWELDGRMDGLTAAALRYRGLGRIEQSFSGDAGIAEAFDHRNFTKCCRCSAAGFSHCAAKQ